MQPVIEQHIDYKNLYEQAQVTIQTLQHELAQIKKLIFGSKHERFIAPSSNQVQQASLDLQAEVVAQCKITNAQKIEYTRLTKQTKAV
jgi:transposase